jgi:hypothetical protein
MTDTHNPIKTIKTGKTTSWSITRQLIFETTMYQTAYKNNTTTALVLKKPINRSPIPGEYCFALEMNSA